jgi:hypothetical protein
MSLWLQSRFFYWIVILAILPVARASPLDEAQFPNIPFKIFSEFVEQNFSSKITLSTALMLLFTLTENPDLLSLHARQQHPKSEGEMSSVASGWLKALSRILLDASGHNQSRFFKKSENHKTMSEDEKTTTLTLKLDSFAKILDLHPYNSQGRFRGNLKTISHQSIEPICMICPNTIECETLQCNSRSILQITRMRDIPQVTLIKGSKSYQSAYVLTGRCPTCNTIYMADHERAPEQSNRQAFTRLYLNSAKYLKVGRNLWVDRLFSGSVLNAIYSFHASAASFMEYWNNSFGQNKLTSKDISRRQVWQAFVQESIRTIAAESQINLVLSDKLGIDEVTQEAFEVLGEQGIIRAADRHACKECTQEYKHMADVISSNQDPAGVVGVDENAVVPALVGPYGQLAERDRQRGSQALPTTDDDNNMDVDNDNPLKAFVRLVVLDGLVFGPAVSS